MLEALETIKNGVRYSINIYAFKKLILTQNLSTYGNLSGEVLLYFHMDQQTRQAHVC